MSFSEGGCLAKMINSYSTYDSPYDKLKAGLLPQHGTYSYKIGLVTVASEGMFDLFEYFFSKTSPEELYNDLAISALKFNNISVLLRLIKGSLPPSLVIKSGNLQYLKSLNVLIEPEYIYEACYSRNREMIDYVMKEIEKELEIKKDDTYDFVTYAKNGVLGAAEIGDESLFNLFLSRLELSRIARSEMYDIHTNAIKGLNSNIIQTWEKIYPMNLIDKLESGIYYGNIHLINKYLDNTLDTYRNDKTVIYSSIVGPLVDCGKVDLLSYVSEKIDIKPFWWDESLNNGVISQSLDTVKFVVKMCSIPFKEKEIVNAVNMAIIKGRLDMIRYLVQTFGLISKKMRKRMRKQGMIL